MLSYNFAHLSGKKFVYHRFNYVHMPVKSVNKNNFGKWKQNAHNERKNKHFYRGRYEKKLKLNNFLFHYMTFNSHDAQNTRNLESAHVE